MEFRTATIDEDEYKVGVVDGEVCESCTGADWGGTGRQCVACHLGVGVEDILETERKEGKEYRIVDTVHDVFFPAWGQKPQPIKWIVRNQS